MGWLLTLAQKLQLEIADFRGIPYEKLFGHTSVETSADRGKTAENAQTVAGTTDKAAASGTESKRKYRRHPRSDDNAPERPPSAYVIFSNKVREEVKGDSLSFTAIAKLVGDRWQKLDANGKEPYEAQAASAKERYHLELSAYKKTDLYKEYTRYLADFRAKHGPGPSEPKRPKLEAEFSSSTLSAKSADLSDLHSSQTAHIRTGSGGSYGSAPVNPTQPSPGGISPASASNPAHVFPTSRLTAASSFASSPSGSLVLKEASTMGRLSTRSSVSDESITIHGEGADPIPRASRLTLQTPPPVASLLPPFPSSDSGINSDPFRRETRTIVYTSSYDTSVPATLSHSTFRGSADSGSSRHLPVSLARQPYGSESGWSRPSDVSRLQDTLTGPGRPPGQERYLDIRAEHRILPPPRPSPPIVADRRYFESISRPGGPLARQETSRSSASETSTSERGEAPLEPSESDAINTLAGLASRDN